MAFTRQDLITLVLENVGVLAAGQAASIEDRACVDRRIAPKLAELAKREVITGLDPDALDDSVALYVADVVAFACRTAFGITGAKADVLTKAAAEAEATLKLMARQYSATAASDGFDVVRDVLEKLGVVAPGQDPTEQDRGVVMARVAPMLATLRLKEVITVPSLEAADPGTLVPLSAILTETCAPAFGVTGDALVALSAQAKKAEATLRALSRQFDQDVGTSTVFDPVQVALEMLGIVSAGQTGSDKDRAVVYARVQPLLMSLRGRDICGVTDLSGLSTDLQIAFARLLAAECALSFSEVPPARIVMLQSMVAGAEQSLRYQSYLYDARPPLRVDRFWDGRRAGAWVR